MITFVPRDNAQLGKAKAQDMKRMVKAEIPSSCLIRLFRFLLGIPGMLLVVKVACYEVPYWKEVTLIDQNFTSERTVLSYTGSGSSLDVLCDSSTWLSVTSSDEAAC